MSRDIVVSSVGQGKRSSYSLRLRNFATYPFQNPPSYEKLIGDLFGACSRRINIQHRLGYQVLDDVQMVKVIRMWTHYEIS